MLVFNVYLLRHGELVESGILCGHSDIELSDAGRQQLMNASKQLPKISQCYTSPLMRCREFAEKFCQQRNLPLHMHSALKEMDFGKWDGQSYQKLWQLEQTGTEETATLGDFWQNPWQFSPPQGESMKHFCARVEHFWNELLAQFSLEPSQNKENSHVLVVSHGGVIRYILAKVLGLPIPGVNHMTNIDVPYGALIHLEITIDNNGQAWPKLML